MRKCFISSQTQLEGNDDWLAALEKYIKCYENEAKICNVAILRHFIAYLEAYKKHLQEAHGKLEKKLKGVPPPR